MSLEKETPAAEPLKFRRRPQREPRNNHRGVFQWTGGVCVGDMRGSDDRISGETCSGERRSTGGTTSETEKANRAGAGVGGLGSSDDLWESITQGERSETTCSVAAKSGKGRGDGLQGLPTPAKVRELQITLYRKAKAEKTYRFWSLYGEVQRTDVLETAWRKVAANGGAAGVDGETIKQIRATPESERAWLERLQGELKTKTYRPQAVRRVMIPKANGGQRPLGIPTVKDRVVQMAVYLVLMPIYEADFHPRSYGFRPQRNAHQAVEAIREALRMGKVEVVDADLAQYFDTIPHWRLLRQVARRIRDGSILKLIRSWLRAPVAEESEPGSRRVNRCEKGTPQGGVISPLLANLYLHPLDEAVNEGCRLQPRMIRYADDLVILCRPGEGQALHERLARWLTASGLRLNETKTRVINSRDDGFEFLGFTFRWQRSSKGTAYVHTEASAASQQRLRQRVREITRRELTWRAPAQVVAEINEVTRGWRNYFVRGHHGKVFGHANYFIGNRLRQWLWRKHGNPGGKYQRWPDRILAQQYGLYRL